MPSTADSPPSLVSAQPCCGRASCGVALAALGAIAFSGKAIIVKLGFRYGADAITLIALRMAVAVPFFASIAWYASRRPGVVPLTPREPREDRAARLPRLLPRELPRLPRTRIRLRVARAPDPLSQSHARAADRPGLLRAFNATATMPRRASARVFNAVRPRLHSARTITATITGFTPSKRRVACGITP